MRKNILILVLLVSCPAVCFSQNPVRSGSSTGPAAIIQLPKPQINGPISLEQALENRRSIHQFTDEALTLNQLGQLCWAAQGITDPNRGFRTAPSAGALYPLQLYVLLPDGLYLYQPQRHELSLIIDKDLRPSVFNSSFNQRVVQKAPCTFIITGAAQKIEMKYRNRGEKFTFFEVGHVAQNIQLQAVTLGLGSVPIGVFDAKTVAQICKLPEGLDVLYLVPVGSPTEKTTLSQVTNVPATQQIAPLADLRTKHVAIIVPSRYFDDTDFYGIQQALVKEGIQPVIASTELTNIKGIQIMGLQRNIITSTILVKDLKVQDFDAFVFVSGSGLGGNYLYNKDIISLVRAANSAGKILAAISEAPAFFAYADIIRGKNVTSSTSKRNKMAQAGGSWQRNLLVIDGNVITAGDSSVASTAPGAAGVSDRFGTAVVGALKGLKITY